MDVDNNFTLVYLFRYKTHDPDYLSKLDPKFQCEICQRLFAGKFLLKNHLKNTHLQSGEKFPCEVCGKTFKYSGHRDDHVRYLKLLKLQMRCMLSKDSVILVKDHIAQKTMSLRYKDHLKAALILLFMFYFTHLVKLSASITT